MHAMDVADYEDAALRKFNVAKKTFCDEGKVGDALAAVSLHWLEPELAYFKTPPEEDEDDKDDGDEDSFVFEEEKEDNCNRPWCRLYSVELFLEDIQAWTGTDDGFTLKVISLDDKCRTWTVNAIDLNVWDITGECKHANAIRDACEILLANTKFDVLRAHKTCQRVDYCDATVVQLWVMVDVAVRCWMSGARVAWMTAVVRAVQ